MKSRFDNWRRGRLVAALRARSEKEVRELIKEAMPGYCLSRIGDKGKRKPALEEYAKAMIEGMEKEEKENGE